MSQSNLIDLILEGIDITDLLFQPFVYTNRTSDTIQKELAFLHAICRKLMKNQFGNLVVDEVGEDNL